MKIITGGVIGLFCLIASVSASAAMAEGQIEMEQRKGSTFYNLSLCQDTLLTEEKQTKAVNSAKLTLLIIPIKQGAQVYSNIRVEQKILPPRGAEFESLAWRKMHLLADARYSIV